MKNGGICWRYKIQETLSIGQWHVSPLQSRNLGTSHSSPSHHELPIRFSWISLMVWNSSFWKVILVLGKARSHRAPNPGSSGAESPGWFDVLPKNCAWDVMHEQTSCHDEASDHRLPIAVAFWIIQIVSMEERSSLKQNLMQICCLTGSVILNVTATQYTCSLKGIYHPHWLVQWSRHCSHMRIPAHSPWLPGYIDVTQIILVILKVVGLFLDRLMCTVFMHVNLHIHPQVDSLGNAGSWS